MAEQWLKDYDKAKQTSVQLANVARKMTTQKLDAKESAYLRGQLGQLRQDVSHLQRSLMASSQNTQAYNVTRKELSRRGDLVTQLSEIVDELQEAVRTGNPGSPLFSSDRPRFRGGGGGGDDAGGLGLLTEQEMLQQDETLDVLSGTVKNLKNIGGEITQELDMHCHMLGELESQTDDAAAKTRRQRGQLWKLSEENAQCHLWACICVLLFVLIFLLVFV
mmetsp:Transcript_60649/g.112497  ORF Transcript_60649/g.112497 Transcript_60649/m.112497 type:complete len:220 (-) Transcript_60649:45-704(-)